MSLENVILWKKRESLDSDLFIELFAGRGYDFHADIKYYVATDLDEYSDTTSNTWLHCSDSKRSGTAKAHREEGKQLFAEGKYFDAMKEFNNALKLAENESEELGLSYANRSSCFFYLNMLEECMIDIELATHSNYPEHLLYKLEDRVKKCTQLVSILEPNSNQFREPELSFEEHIEFPGVADCLEIQQNDTFGRHVVALCNLKIGQTILVEPAYSIVPYSKSDYRSRCAHCLKEYRNFIPCKNCVDVLFCDEKCMEQSFHKYHCVMWVPEPDGEKFKVVLSTFFKLNAAFPDFDFLVHTVKLLLKDKHVAELSNEQRKFCRLFQLAHNYEKKSDEEVETLRIVASHCFHAIVKSLPDFKGKFSDLKRRRFLQHLIFHLCHITEYEHFMHEYLLGKDDDEISGSIFDGYASAMFLFGSHINHSCLPNVFWLTVDDRLICKVIRPIKRGEQIFRAYSVTQPILKSHVELRARLADKYHFKCECLLCLGTDHLLSENEVNLFHNPLWKYGVILSYATVKEFRQLSREKIVSHEEKAINFLEKYNRFHPVDATSALQRTLVIIWNLLSSPFELVSIASPVDQIEQQ